VSGPEEGIGDNIVIYCSSVWGGYSWTLTDTNDKALVRRLCKKMSDTLDATFRCCSLLGLLTLKSRSKDINAMMHDFIDGVSNGEYEQFEDLGPADLQAEALLDSQNEEWLLELLEVFFDSGYSSDAVVEFLEQHGVGAVLCS
jgi:hypothetical protein